MTPRQCAHKAGGIPVRIGILALLLTVTIPRPAMAAPDEWIDYRATLDHFNDQLRWAGSDPALLDPENSLHATLHSEYLWLNKDTPEIRGFGAEQELDGKPGFTEQGANHSNQTVIGDIDDLFATPVHHPVLSPEAVAFGKHPLGPMVWRHPLDTFASRYFRVNNVNEEVRCPALNRVSQFPGPGQTIDRVRGSRSNPDPVPPQEYDQGVAGYPITLWGASIDPSHVERAELHDDQGRIWPCAILQNFQEITMVPRQPLVPGSTYTVHLDLLHDGCTPETYTWSFSVASQVRP